MEIQSTFNFKFDEKSLTQSVPEFFLSRFQKFGNNLALIDSDSGKQWKYSEIERWVSHTIQNLKQDGGYENRSRVAIASLNCPEVLFLQMACGVLGSSVTMLNAQGTVDELWHQVDLSEATIIVAQPKFIEKLEEVRKKAQSRGGGRLKTIVTMEKVVFDPPTDAGKLTLAKFNPERKERSDSMQTPKTTSRSMSQAVMIAPASNGIRASASTQNLTLHGSPANRRSRLDLDEMGLPVVSSAYCLFFSSGTTGLPKPVEIPNRSFNLNMQQMSAPYLGPPAAKDRILLQLPLHHIYGTLVAYWALYNGCTGVSMPKYRTDIFLRNLQDYKISYLHTVPPMVNTLATDPLVDTFDLSCLKYITCAAAPLDPLIGQQCSKRLQLKDMRQCFGMTELCGVSTWSHFGCNKIDSIGKPLAGIQCKIVHPDKRHQLGAGTPGELMMKGIQITPRYYKNPKSTGELYDRDGWLKTGDLAYYDLEGYIFIVDRLKDIIKYKGTQVSPTEVEVLLRSHPGVGDCAVIGRPEAQSGEVPAAFIVRHPDSPLLTAADIRQHVRGKLSGFKELKGGIFFVQDIPRSVSGKVLRRQLKNFWDRKDGGGTTDSADSKSKGKSKKDNAENGKVANSKL